MALGLNKNQVQKIKELKDTLEKENRSDPAVIAKIVGIVKDLGLDSDINKPLDGDPALVTASTSKKHGGTTLAHYAASENYAIILDYLNETYGPTSSASPKLDLTLERREQYGKSGKKKVKKETPALLAIKNKNHNAMRALVRAGADFNTPEVQKELKAKGLEGLLSQYQDAQKFEDELKPNPEYFRTITEADLDTFISGLNNKINAVDDKKWNVAHHIAQWGNEDRLMYLIKNDANLMALNDKGETAIQLIRDDKLRERIQNAYQAHLSQKGLDGVEWDKVNLTQIKSLVDFGADVTKGPYAHQALRAGKTEIVEYLISKGINLNAADPADNKTLVELAAERGDTHILMDLVEHSFKDPTKRVNWSPKGTNVLDNLKLTNKDLADKIQDALNATESLLDLSSSGLGVSWDDIQPDQIQELLDMGACINAQNKEGQTALFQASKADNLNAAKQLLKNGADPNIAGEYTDSSSTPPKVITGVTPTHLAAELAIVPKPATKKGKTEYHLQDDFLKLLAENRADFNKQNEPDKKTPVHILFERINQAYEYNKANNVTQIPNEMLRNLVENLVKAGTDFEIEDSGDSRVVPPVPPQKPIDYLTNPDLKKIIEEQIENARTASPTEAEIGPTETPAPEPDREAGSTSTPDGHSVADGSGADSGITDPDKAHPGLGKRLSDALKESTENFCKNVFEANHKTAEDFAEAFLFNLLAFPLDASSTLLSKVYSEDEKDKLDKLIRRLDRLMADRADGSDGSVDRIPASQLTKDLGKLRKAVLNTTNRLALQKLQGIVGPAPDINATKEQRDEYMKKVGDAFRDNPDIQDAFKKGFETIAKDPEGKALMERCFSGHTGTLSNDQILSALTGIPVDKLATRTADSHAPTDGPVVPDGATPKLQEAIMKNYQKIMDSNSLDKDAKKLQLEAFLQKQAEEHPEFKTLAKAFTLSQRKTAILNSLKKDPAYLTKSGNLTNKGVTFLNSKKEFDGFSRDEIKETIKMASTLRETLKKGSEEGKAYLAGKLQEKAAKIER